MESEENQRPAQHLAIYKKGEEILDVVRQICDLFPEENKELQYIKGDLIADASILVVKVAGAEAAELYDLKMEAATIIRKAACDLKIKNHTLKMFGFQHTDYYSIVRELIEEYRLLFIQWVAGFDKWNYIIDRWGLFNPPGVGPFDKDPDDDIPFNQSDNDF